MFGFGEASKSDRCAAIVDIGSGSVGIALVHSKVGASAPTIVWSHREHALIKDVTDIQATVQQINTALINVFLELGATGRKALKSYDSALQIETVQAAIAAPWSYTVTKTVNFTDEHPFTVDDELIESLTETAEKQAVAAIEETEMHTQGLEMVIDATINTRINGYNVTRINDQTGRHVAIAHTSALAEKSILDTLREGVDKVVPQAKVTTFSFMYLYYCMLKNQHLDVAEACLIDITSEATEVAIVRDGVLQHVTHAPYGTYTLAREIASACVIPKEEAYTYLKGGASFIDEKLSEAAQKQLAAIISTYELKIASLFKSTGDTLSIPKTVFLHTDQFTEPFFQEHMQNAAAEATGGNHTIHLVTAKLLAGGEADDTPILLSAHFFHRDMNCDMEV